MCAKGPGQLFLVAATVDRNRPEAKSRRELDAEMAESADPVDGDEVSCARARIADRIEGRSRRR
jgi:hypothetical protein